MDAPQTTVPDERPSGFCRRITLHEFAFGQFAARRPMGVSRWSDFDLFWVHSGRIRLRFGRGGEESLRAGEGLLIYPDTAFTGAATSKVCRASVHHFAIADGDEDELPLPLRRLCGRRHGYERYEPDDATEVQAALARAVRWSSCRQTPMVKELRVAQFTAVLAQLALGSRESRPADLADAAFERLVEELGRRLDKPMTLHEMANRLGLSPSHFRARFRALYGSSPGAYLLRIRMIEATRLLTQTRIPVKTVARRVGYEQVNAFFRMFRLKIGFTPGDYRRRYATR